MKRVRAFTLVELLVVIAIIALLVSLLLPALAKAQKNARSLKDKAQIRQIHMAYLGFANDNPKGKLPTPGLINRLAFDVSGTGGGVQVSGAGPEDYSLNHSASLYSASIAQNLFGTELLIGPTEVNPVVVEDRDYDFSEFDPTSDTYWDPDFKVEINLPTGEANASYFHMALCGKRKSFKWQNTQTEGDPMLSTRGTANGNFSSTLYTLSQTLELHGPRNQWVGNVVFSDNHTETIDNFYPTLTSYERIDAVTGAKKDNIFSFESDDPNGVMASADAWLVMSREPHAEHTASPIYDFLVD
jgi:prepilin-type N-terminal cleavage/methylation domain-containing protein